MNKTFKKIFSVCCAVVTTLTATLFHSTNLSAGGQKHKIVFAGPSETGKTKLVSRICGNSYNSDYVATMSTDFASSSQLTLWDTTGNTRFLDIMAGCFKSARLCVLSISMESQETEDFLNMLADYDVPNVVLCITKTDKGIPDSEEVSRLLAGIKQKLPDDVTVFDEVLYTSAQKNTFKFCTPDEYTASNESYIYNVATQEKVLAAKLYELCGDKAEDSQSETYAAGTSYEESIEYDSFTGKPNTSTAKSTLYASVFPQHCYH
ncbi:MAG: hypothetical protein IJC57_04115 [Clostridia bacterium]|nr:hypothetical protein [Clostridia bacterium]